MSSTATDNLKEQLEVYNKVNSIVRAFGYISKLSIDLNMLCSLFAYMLMH